MSGAGALVQNGGGALTLIGVERRLTAATLTINAGSIVLASSTALGTGAVTFAAKATLEATATTTVSGPMTINSGVSATFGAKSGVTLALAGPASFSGGAGTTLHFGSSTDTGTVSCLEAANVPALDLASALAVDGGTLKVGSYAGAVVVNEFERGLTVGSGTTAATLDMDGQAITA